MRRFLVVSSLPASGKSTIAREVATRFALPLFDKDSFLEALFETAEVRSAPDRRSLSREADAAFQRAVAASNGGVLASWWRHPRSGIDSGTSVDWLPSLAGDLVEIHCECSAAVAARRFLERRRHPSHLDGRWSDSELVSSFGAQAALGPLGVGRLVSVSTEGGLAIDALASEIASAFTATPGGEPAA